LEVVVEVRDVYKSFGPTVALSGVSLSVERGSFLVLLGPNGSGKSTLIDIVCGFRRPSRGYVKVFGSDPWRERSRIAKRVACLSDRLSVKPWASCLDELERFASRGMVDGGKASEYASRLGVDEYWTRPYIAYSAGMRRKCLLLLALSMASELLVIDEPFENLDAEAIRATLDILEEKRREGATIVAASHIVAGLERLATHVAVLVSGRLVEWGRSIDVAARLGGLRLVAEAPREALSRILEAAGPRRSCIREDVVVVEVESLERAEELRKLIEGLGAKTRLEVDLEAVYRRALQAPKS